MREVVSGSMRWHVQGDCHLHEGEQSVHGGLDVGCVRCMSVCPSVCLSACLSVCLHVCTYVCTYVFIYYRC